MIIKEGVNVPIQSWCNDPDEGTLKQALNLSSLPFIFKHVGLMPDTHLGFGMPIGGVIACKNVIIPYAVGSDGGCGMLAIKTSLTDLNQSEVKNILAEIKKKIPIGFDKHKYPQKNELYMPETLYPVMLKEEDNLDYQLGTLGGGNHFIEIQKGDDGHIWFMIHSGSRNLGKQVCDYYNKIAKSLNKKWYSKVDPKWNLAFLPTNTKEAKAYLAEMNFALKFAKENRKLMGVRVKEAFNNFCPVEFLQEINIHHNYASLENHFGQNVWVHRKGATAAFKDQLGIIPSSQGACSFIVKGKGNIESFKSCSHGAGRHVSRTESKKKLNLQTEIDKMDKQGIVHNITDINDLDEAPGAYKDINIILEEQKDLVDIVVKLTPLGVIKAKRKPRKGR